MRTLANRPSIPTSSLAVLSAGAALIEAAATLIVALVTGPVRLIGRLVRWHASHRRVACVDVQVLLDDPRRVLEVRRAVARGLACAARIWAPLQLPVQRVVVGAGAPFQPDGRVDIYQGFPTSGSDVGTALVVITLGVRRDQHDLDASEIISALASRIEALIADRFPCRSLAVEQAAEPARPVGQAAPPTQQAMPRPVDSLPTLRPARASNAARRVALETPAAPLTEGEGETQPTAFADTPRLALPTNGQTH